MRFGRGVLRLSLSMVLRTFEQIRELKIQSVWYMFGGLQSKTVTTKWITAEIDRITALIYFVIIISVFIVAIVLLPDLLQKFAQVFEDIESVRRGIFIFSVLALAAVCGMFVLRILGLMNKARIVFKYPTLLEGIKVDAKRFETNLHGIERYLNDNGWTLAEYWVNRVQQEYTEETLEMIQDRQNKS